MTERHDYRDGFEQQHACVIVTMRGLDDVLSGLVDGAREIQGSAHWNASVSVWFGGDYRYRGPRAAPEGSSPLGRFGGVLSGLNSIAAVTYW